MKAVRPRAVALLPLLFVALIAAGAGADKPFVTANDFPFQQLLGDPPADDSDVHRAEVDAMLALQAARTPADEARCTREVKVDPFIFKEVIGEAFQEKDLPVTAKFLAEVTGESTAISTVAKNRWGRVRPPLANPSIKPCVPLEKSASYPSGHATRGVVWATILSEIFPDKREAIMARGKLIGQDRVIAGMHYPSDVAAGQKLGAAIAKKMLADAEFQSELAKVKDECHAAVFAHH